MAIEFEGLDEILDSLDKLADTKQLNDTMGQVCALVERDAKQNAPALVRLFHDHFHARSPQPSQIVHRIFRAGQNDQIRRTQL